MKHRRIAVAGLVLGFCSAPAVAQLTVYLDSESASSCDLVNASNTELAVLDETLELVIVAGEDVVLINTFVDCDGTVTIDGVPSGFVGYAEDGDGFRTLWWLTDSGTVMEFDVVTFVPFDSGVFPADISIVPCDACDLWDGFLCAGFLADFDGDGVEDFLDFCCDTPFDSFVDFDGCACFELDDDLDGVDNCDDFCIDTPFDAFVDGEGCQIIIIIDDGVPGGDTSIVPVSLMCGSFSTLSLAMMFAGLATLRTRRWIR